MKLSLSRADLLSALDRVTRIAKPGPQSFMETLLLEVEGESLILSGTDFDIEAAVSCAAEVEAAGSATVPAEAFSKLIKRLPSGVDVDLETLPDPARVLVKARRSKVNLPSLNPSEHVRFGEHSPTHRFAMPAKTLAAMLRDVAFAAPDDESYGGSVFGVCLHHDPDLDKLTTVATNTHKLACRREATPDGAAGMPRALLGLKAVEEITRLCAAAGDENVEIALSERMIEARGADTVLRSKLVEQVFAPYERILPREAGARLVVEAEALRHALARAELVTSGRGSGVRIDLADGILTVSVSGANGAGIVDEIEGDYEDGADSFSISAKLAQEILKVIDSDVAHVEVGRGRKHTVWRRSNGDGLMCFLMPMIG